MPGQLVHAAQLALTMRAEDVEECRAGGLDPSQALVQSLSASDRAYAALLGDEVGAMFGVGRLAGVSERVGHVWFLTGVAFAKHPRAFVRVARRAVGEMLERYPVLFNIIDARYAAAVRWAKWLGFEVGAPQPFGPAGVPFVPARLRRDAWAP